MRFLKDNRLGVKAAIILSVATLLAAFITTIPYFLQSNDKKNSVKLEREGVKVVPNNISIKPSDSIFERKLSNGIHYLEKGDDINLVQFHVNQKLSDFEIDDSRKRGFNDILFNENYDHEKLDTLLNLADSLFDSLSIQTSSLLHIDSEQEIKDYKTQVKYDELFDSLVRSRKLKFQRLNRFAPVFDITIFNRSNKKLIMSNMEIDLVSVGPVGYGGGGPTDMAHADSIGILSLYELKIPKQKLYYYSDLEMVNSSESYRDSLEASFNNRYKKQLEFIDSKIYQYDKVSLAEEIYYSKIYQRTIDDEVINFNLLPPLEIPKDSPVRFQFRISHQGPEMETFELVVRLKFYNSTSIIEIPLQFLM